MGWLETRPPILTYLAWGVPLPVAAITASLVRVATDAARTLGRRTIAFGPDARHGLGGSSPKKHRVGRQR